MPRVPSLNDRFLGCLLGVATGDAIGAPFEGLGPYDIYQGFGASRGIIDRPPLDALYYTDDTQMTIAVVECLLDTGGLDEGDLMERFVRNFQPERGYGPGARRLLEAACAGDDWRSLRHTIYPGGSFGNGAAMRAAPVGLAFRYDPDRVWDEAARSALPTHTHPIGIEGAQLVALAVALASCMEAFDRPEFFYELSRRATTDEFQWQLSVAADLGPDVSPAQFGNDLRADRSVVTSIACFAAYPGSYRDAVSGAHLGVDALPPAPLATLEDGPKGRSYIRHLAERLAALVGV
jgi:poly(ADP-ribose) glycohydrolase ARH3